MHADFEPSNILYNAVSDEKYVSDTRHVVVVSKKPLPIFDWCIIVRNLKVSLFILIFGKCHSAATFMVVNMKVKTMKNSNIREMQRSSFM